MARVRSRLVFGFSSQHTHEFSLNTITDSVLTLPQTQFSENATPRNTAVGW